MVLEPIDEYISTEEDCFQKFEIIPDLSLIQTLFSFNFTDGCRKRSLSCLLFLILWSTDNYLMLKYDNYSKS
ncbi:hypothetical protein BpHYR1_043959 [Brachionus plicatilis]|uniref:Uncharacterized protein n=1 Tax=Brachionus plicatilis TaxID=10195 RepID=A0A3M7P365_BRAPC|nr:hypothetical protein BpHYR1_043959 [Brachionus plicatilis]